MWFQISTCNACQRASRKLTTNTPDLHPIPVESPWFHVAIDFIEPIILAYGNMYILTLSDYFTKFVEAVPLPEKSAHGN